MSLLVRAPAAAQRQRAAAPVHLLVPEQPRHGVSILAGQLARAAGARVQDAWSLPRPTSGEAPRAHLHLSDRLVADDPREAVARVHRLARRWRLTVPLHDVPQPADGTSFVRRVETYREMLRPVEGWVTNSRVERDRVVATGLSPLAGAVVPLPLVPARVRPRAVARPVPAGSGVVAVLGWVYPGKGHEEALRAAALLGDAPASRPTVVALGAVAPGHERDAASLRDLAQDLGVRLRVTGWLSEASLRRWSRRVHVAVAGHRNVSASGSINSWVVLGHRPLVRDGDYAREMDRLRPGTLALLADLAPDALAAAVDARLRDQRLTVPAAARRWRLEDCAAAYRSWWSCP